MVPLCGSCRRRARTESRHPEDSLFSISETNSDSQKNILSPLVPAVSLGPGAFDFSTRIKQYHSTSQSRTPPGAARDNRLGADFTHLGWGKSSVWLALSGSQRSFRAEARTHFAARDRMTERRRMALSIPGIAMLLTRRSCPVPSGVRTNTIITSVWPCAPLCAPLAGRAGTLSLPGGCGPVWAAVPPLWREPVRTTSRFLFRLRGTKEKAG